MEKPISTEMANKIYDLLLEVGAAESWRENFVFHVCGKGGIHEYRFGGELGFGGKFYNYSGRWYISCYIEDRTPEREKIILDINAKLDKLMQEESLPL